MLGKTLNPNKHINFLSFTSRSTPIYPLILLSRVSTTMSLSYQSSIKCCARAVKAARPQQCMRISSPLIQRHATSRRWQSTDAAVTSTSPKIQGIVDQISQLTLLETADLVSGLKVKHNTYLHKTLALTLSSQSRLNIPDMPMGGFMPMGGAPGGPAAATPTATPAAEEEDTPAPAAQEKTLFTLKLESFDPAAKPKVIKEVKSMLGLSLVDSKKFVESAPKVMKEGMPKEECEKIVETMKALGAVVKME